MSGAQNAGKIHDTQTVSESFETVAKLLTTLTNQNCMHDDLKRKLNSGKAATTRMGIYGLPALLPNIIKIKIRSIISFNR